ncbi:MAG TPA: hypothetical protein VK463_07435, partial [Desulfomonilaceae bacterium]|nr:hypothetical protein [Desulfomonilaceae bacterium]
MNGLQTSSRILRHLVFVGVFGTATAFAAFHLRDQLGPFFMTRPSINGVILGLGLMGFLICVTELVRLYRQAKEMSGLADSLAVGFPDFPDEAVNRVRGGIVKDRVARTLALIRRGAAHTEALGLISDADVDSEESRGAFVRYVLGVMVFLGLIGTFWGVLITVESVQKVLEA